MLSNVTCKGYDANFDARVDTLLVYICMTWGSTVSVSLHVFSYHPYAFVAPVDIPAV